jgi:hypothetical protein
MIKRAQEALEKGEFLNEFHPVPEDLKIVAGRVGTDDDVHQKALGLQEQANKAKHGYANWYDWCVNEWGTKWDVNDEGTAVLHEDGSLTASFSSAWAPPIQAYGMLEDLGFEVKAYYFEGGMMFAGVYEDGDDDYYDLGEMNSSEMFDILPEDLNEMFGISDQVEEYEAEQEADNE